MSQILGMQNNRPNQNNWLASFYYNYHGGSGDCLFVYFLQLSDSFKSKNIFFKSLVVRGSLPIFVT